MMMEIQKIQDPAEKENDNVESGQRRRLLKNMTKAEVVALKKDIFSRIARCDATLTQLDKGFEELQISVERMLKVIEECKNLVKAQMLEGKDIRHVLRDTTCSSICKTNVVIPMVGGIPLKKARISLKRLGPAYSQLHTRGTSATESQIANGSSNRTPNNRARNYLGGPSSTRARGRL